jgi:hypothetical protein
MTLNRDQITNIEHKIAFGVGSALIAYMQTQPTNTWTTPLTWVGGALLAWSGYKSNQLNATPVVPPSTSTTTKVLLLFTLLTLGLATGCTSFVTATGQNKVIMTESSTVFGINIQAASSANATPAVQLGLVRQTIQFLPFSLTTNSNGTTNHIQVPDYVATYDIKQGITPFSFNGYESFASGLVSTYEPGVGTTSSNGFAISVPTLPH